MGGFMTGLLGELGKQVQAHHERNVGYQHQAQEEQAKVYDEMAKKATESGNDALAADLMKGSFAIRTTMPGQKPKKLNDASGAAWDPLDMQGLIANHTRMALQRQANGPPPVQPLAPNGITPGNGLFNSPNQQPIRRDLPAPPNTDDPGAPGAFGVTNARNAQSGGTGDLLGVRGQ